MPGGETLDGLAVWLPEERTVWIGNLMGALWGALPHLSTIRGDRPRSAMLFIESVQRVLDLEPELLLTGHDEPIRGAERIQREVSEGPRRGPLHPRQDDRGDERRHGPGDADGRGQAAPASSRPTPAAAPSAGTCARCGRSTSAGFARKR